MICLKNIIEHKRYKNILFKTKELAFFLGFFLILSIAKSNSYPLSELNKQRTLDSKYFTCYEDTTRKVSIKDVMDGKKEHLIKQVSYYENLDADYIIAFKIHNDTKHQDKWVLELVDGHINVIEFYQKGASASFKQGFTLPFELKKYQHKNHIFDLNIAPGDTAQCYFRLHSKSHVAFNTKLQTNAYFTHYSLTEYFLLGLFYGFLLIMAVYNVILYFFTKMRTRLYYALYVVSCLFTALAEDGLGFHFIWSGLPKINNWWADIQPIFYLLFYVFYSLSFIDIKQRSKRFKRAILFSTLGYTLIHVFCIYYRIMPVYWLPSYFVTFGLIWVYSLKNYLAGNKSLRFLFLGTTLILVSYMIFYTRMLGIVSTGIFVVYSFNFAVTVEILLFSIAMGDKLRAIQQENLKDKELVIKGLKENEELSNKVNKELEEKVSERTKDLNKAKLLLEQQAKEITEMNLQLDLHNRSLSKKVVEVSKKRVHSEAIDPEEFHEHYPNKLECYKLLEEIKWKNGFSCRKCSNTTFAVGTSFRSRRCTKCGTTETPTANTIFHGLRIPIESAFYLFALIVQSKGEMSSVDLELKTGINQKVCWSFKQKITEKLEQHKKGKNSWDQIIF